MPQGLTGVQHSVPRCRSGKNPWARRGVLKPVCGMVWALMLRSTGAARITLEGVSLRDRWALRLIFCF